MKKLLLVAAGALFSFAAASASAPDSKVGANIEGKTLTKATELVNGHHYLIWDDSYSTASEGNRRGFHYPASAGEIRKDRTDKTVYTPDYVWTAVAVTNDAGEVTGWKLFNQGYQKNLTKLTHGGNTGVNGDADAVLTYTQTDGTFSFTDNTSGEMWNGNPDNLAGWTGAHPIFMYDLADNGIADYYYHVTLSGNTFGYYRNGTVLSSEMYDDVTVDGPKAITLKAGVAAFKFQSGRLSARWASTNDNGVTTSTRDNAEWFIEVPGGNENELKMFSLNKNAWLKAPTNSADPTALSTDASEAAVFTRTRSTTGAEIFFSGNVGFNIRDNHVAGWTLTDIGSYWFQVYDEEAFNENIAYYQYSNDANKYSTAIADAQALIDKAVGKNDETIATSDELANLRSGLAAVQAARFGKPGLKAKVDAIAPLCEALSAIMDANNDSVDNIINAGNYIAVTLGLGNAADKEAWAAASNVTKPLPMPDYYVLRNAFSTLLTNASLHMPEDGMPVYLRHPQRENTYMGLNNGNLNRVAGGNKKVITLKNAPNGEGFVMYCEYADGYIKHPTETNANATFVTDINEASVYTLDLQSIVGVVEEINSTTHETKTHEPYNFGFVANTAVRKYLHSNSGNDVCNVVGWNQGPQSSWYIEPTTAETAANEYLAGAKAYFDGLTFGTGIGEYGITPDSQAAADAAKLVGTDATIAEKRAAGNTLRNPQTALNMPQVGHVYMFSKADGSKYMSADNMTTNMATMVEPTQANLLTRLFYLDEDHHLVALMDGRVMGAFLSTDKGHDGNSWSTVLLSNTAKVGVFSFSEAATHGKYVIAAQGNNRNMYNGHDDVDCGGTPGNVAYHWTIEEVKEWIPMVGTEAGNDHVTLCLPFAVKTRDGMTVHTAKVTNGKVIPVEFEGNVIPANTPVLVDFSGVQRDDDNHLVYLERHYGDVPEIEGNELQGSVYAFEVSTPVAVRSGEKTFAAASGTVHGLQAYIPGGLHTFSTQAIEDELSGLVGKVFTLRNTDLYYNRGFLIYKEGQTSVWTSNKAPGNLGADAALEASATDPNYRWTLVEHDGKRYLYNIAAGKFAANTGKAVNVGNSGAEFIWVFSDYPTAIDFHFYDYDIAETIEGAKFNILGGENTGTARPAGFLIANGYASPVLGIGGTAADDGCGFWITVLDGVEAPAEIASVADAQAAMEAEHAAAAAYVADRGEDETFNDVPGHYNAEGYTAFAEKINAANLTDAQSKYYAVVRARQAAGTRINTFAHNGAYNLFDANGDKLVAKISWNEARYTLSVGIADETTGEYDGDWLCEVQDDGTLLFTHGFGVDEKSREENARAAVRARVESANEEGIKVATVKLQEPAAATYDGMGNIMVGDLAVKSSAALEDAHTTGISELTADADAQATGAAYDLMGRRVNASAKGIVIINGKKTLRL